MRDRYPTWQTPTYEERIGDGPDVAVAVSVTHDVLNDVRIYAAKALPQVGSKRVC